MAVTDLPIIGYYDKQRFPQYNPADCANWYLVPSDLGKKKVAMYPTMGRQHVIFNNMNQLIFPEEPRAIFKSINFWYVVIGDQIIKIDSTFTETNITASESLVTSTTDIFFTYLVASTNTTTPDSGGITFACFSDGQRLYIYREDTGAFGHVTDGNLPVNPLYLSTFGNRIVVSSADTATFGLSEINLGGSSFDLSTCFTIGSSAVFAQESGIIRQMGVLQNTLYIFTDFTTGIWSNIPSSFISSGGTTTQFPFKKNTTYDWNFGIADPNSLDIDFGMICFLAKNRNGLLQVMVSNGDKPVKISTKAIDVLLQNAINAEAPNPTVSLNIEAFLYSYENTIFYRMSAGGYTGTGLLDQDTPDAFSLEYNFDVEKWNRCIEQNGERNRIQQHVFFNNQHYVTILGDGTIYEMSGQYYVNEVTNPDQPNPQKPDSYLQLPFRYERVTPIICSGLIDVLQTKDYYAEFITDYIEIDFVWGDQTFHNSTMPFDNAVFIVDEAKDAGGNPIYITSETDANVVLVSEQGNFPVLNSDHYNAWFKPHVELYFSDDGGISFHPKDVAEFSQLGIYQWRMRWYQLGPSRNRVYKLVCVSPAPIVVLGAVMDIRRSSGGAA